MVVGREAPARQSLFGSSRVATEVAATPSQRLRALGLALPPPPSPAGSYSPVLIDGPRAWVSGQVALQDGAVVHPGLVDRDLSPEVAKEVARRATLQALSALEMALGSIDRVRQILRVGIYVASVPTFTRQHEVGNGATELLISIFGDAGRPARISMGVAALPLNAPVEVEMTVAVAEG
jgi:enamine deaminase RidA (YjgF/YER057c/UK114 family)